MTEPKDLLLRSTPPDSDASTLIAVDPDSAGWEFCSLIVIRLAAGATWQGATGRDEVALVPLSGTCTVTSGGETWEIGGRANVFDGPTATLYLPIGTDYTVTASESGPLELAVCGARAETTFPARFTAADAIPVEVRGAGNAARQIRTLVPPSFPAHRLLVIEVITPSGNWSSYPPHKHDVDRMPTEADLEEIYYYRLDKPEGFALQRLYTEDGRIDEAWTIRDGDLLLVPEGYHAFAVAHGYTGYYLNVLAGANPARTLQPVDDPAHAWTRATWDETMNEGAASFQEIDARINRGAGHRP